MKLFILAGEFDNKRISNRSMVTNLAGV
jgi:hypothetical protein